MRAYPQLSAFGKVGTWRTFRKSRNILGSSSFSKMTVCKKKRHNRNPYFKYILDIAHLHSSYSNISLLQHFSILHFFTPILECHISIGKPQFLMNHLCYLHPFSPAITGAKLYASQAEMSDSGTNLLACSFVNKVLFI